MGPYIDHMVLDLLDLSRDLDAEFYRIFLVAEKGRLEKKIEVYDGCYCALSCMLDNF